MNHTFLPVWLLGCQNYDAKNGYSKINRQEKEILPALTEPLILSLLLCIVFLSVHLMHLIFDISTNLWDLIDVERGTRSFHILTILASIIDRGTFPVITTLDKALLSTAPIRCITWIKTSFRWLLVFIIDRRRLLPYHALDASETLSGLFLL